MDVNGDMRVFFPDATNKQRRRLRLEHSRHYIIISERQRLLLVLITLAVFNAQHMRSHVDDLVGKVEIVFKIVLLLRVQH